MSFVTVHSNVGRGEWTEVTQEKREGRFLFFFPIEWWETTKTTTSGNEIHVRVDDHKKIDAVYVNGEEYTKNLTAD